MSPTTFSLIFLSSQTLFNFSSSFSAPRFFIFFLLFVSLSFKIVHSPFSLFILVSSLLAFIIHRFLSFRLIFTSHFLSLCYVFHSSIHFSFLFPHSNLFLPFCYSFSLSSKTLIFFSPRPVVLVRAKRAFKF